MAYCTSAKVIHQDNSIFSLIGANIIMWFLGKLGLKIFFSNILDGEFPRASSVSATAQLLDINHH